MDQIRSLATTLIQQPSLAQEVRSLTVFLFHGGKQANLNPRCEEKTNHTKVTEFVAHLPGDKSDWNRRIVSGDELA
jgi:hypothetical protein